MPSKEKTRHTDQLVPGLVSVITPVYNSAAYLEACVASVQAQTYTNWELILVDDASTDNSLELVQSLCAGDARIRYYSNDKNQGAAFSRNLATQEAKGEYIAFLDSDDLWEPQKLQLQIDKMQESDNPVCFGSYVRIDGDGNELGIRIKAMPELSYSKQIRNNYIGNLTGIYNAAELDKILAPDIRKRQDWAVWLEAIKRSGQPAVGIQQDLARYRVGQASISSNKWKLLRYNFRFYREYLQFSGLKAMRYTVVFLWEYFVQRPKWIEHYK